MDSRSAQGLLVQIVERLLTMTPICRWLVACVEWRQSELTWNLCTDLSLVPMNQISRIKSHLCNFIMISLTAGIDASVSTKYKDTENTTSVAPTRCFEVQ